MTDLVLFLTTVPSHVLGERLARTLVDRGLAACVNVHQPMTSYYRWKGQVERSVECQLVVKTARANVEAVIEAVRAEHPYELPESLTIGIDGGAADYLEWVGLSSKRDA